MNKLPENPTLNKITYENKKRKKLVLQFVKYMENCITLDCLENAFDLGVQLFLKFLGWLGK